MWLLGLRGGTWAGSTRTRPAVDPAQARGQWGTGQLGPYPHVAWGRGRLRCGRVYLIVWTSPHNLLVTSPQTAPYPDCEQHRARAVNHPTPGPPTHPCFAHVVFYYWLLLDTCFCHTYNHLH